MCSPGILRKIIYVVLWLNLSEATQTKKVLTVKAFNISPFIHFGDEHTPRAGIELNLLRILEKRLNISFAIGAAGFRSGSRTCTD